MPTTPRFLDVHAESERTRGLSFQQIRIALFLRMLATFFGLFLLLGGVKAVLIIWTEKTAWIESSRQGGIAFAAIFVLIVALWMVVRSHPRAPRVLDVIDSAGTVVTCAALTAMLPLIPIGTAEFGTVFLLILILVKHASDVPEPPSQRTELEVPAALEDLVMACLGKKPEQRSASALELRHRLTGLDLDWTEEDAAEWWRLHHPG